MKRFLLLIISYCVTLMLQATPIQLAEGGVPDSHQNKGHRAPAKPFSHEYYLEVDLEESSLFIRMSGTTASVGFEVLLCNESGFIICDLETDEESLEICNLASGNYTLEIVVEGLQYMGTFSIE